MPQIRRKLVAVAAVAAAALLTVPALPTDAAPAAATGDQYTAESTASSLLVNLFGQGFTIGAATADADSGPKAHAAGQGALVATQSFGASSAEASKVGDSAGSETPTCSELQLPQDVPLLDLAAACSSAQAAVTDAGPSATAAGQAFALSLAGDPALSAIPVADLTDQITDALLGGLAPLTGAFPVPTGVVVDQVTQLINDALVGDVPVLSVEGGASEANASSDGDSVDATTTSHGATVKLIDREQLNLDPILTVHIGSSTTSVTRNRTTGQTKAEATAIPVTISVAPDLAALLQLPQSTFEAPEGQQVDLPLPMPLTSSVKLSSGSTSDIENGKRADSATLELNLLQGVNGGIKIAVSNGSSAVAGTLAPKVETETTAPPTTTPAPVAPTTLPRTGVEESSLGLIALVLAMAAAGTGALVWTASRRTRTARG